MFSLFKKSTSPVATPPSAPPVASPDLQAQADVCIEAAYALEDANQWDDAIAQYRAALALVPGYWRALVNLGNALKAVGQLDAAHQHYQEAYAQNPNSHGTCYNLGADYIRLGLMAEAVPLLQRAIDLKPDFADAMVLLAEALEATGQALEGGQWLARAVSFRPDDRALLQQLLEAQEKNGLLHEGAQTAMKMMRLFAPGGQIDHIFLAEYYRRNNEVAHEVQAYQAMPKSIMTTLMYSNYLYALNFLPEVDPIFKLKEHKKFNEILGVVPILSSKPALNKKVKTIGFVSPDFCNHPVFDFIYGLLLNLDRQCFRVLAYGVGPHRDACTDKVIQAVDGWRDLQGLDDRTAAEIIHQDGVDILIDLAGHTGYNAMPMLCYRPAPVMASWLGYPTTTGVEVFDFRIVDGYTDPPGLTEAHHSEQLIRLPHAQWCYTPWREFLPVSDLPALHQGYITFGSFGVRRKVTDQMVQIWAQLMAGLHGSRLLLANIRPGVDQDRITNIFKAQGVTADRIEFVQRTASFKDYAQRFHQVDMVLDTHPYTGCTTICDALYMGVPALTIAGQQSVSRCAASLMTQVGLPEFVAHSPDSFVATGMRVAADLPALAQVRAGLRQRFMASPLGDQARFAQDFADALDAMWAQRRSPGGQEQPQPICATQDAAVLPDWGRLAEYFRQGGEVVQALHCYRQMPISAFTHQSYDNYLLTLSYIPDLDPEWVLAEHRRYRLTIQPGPQVTLTSRAPDGVLRVGFISPDFYDHPVSDFVVELFAQLDRSRYQLHAYYANTIQDAVTARIRAQMSGWRDISNLGAQAAAQQIAADGIDILIDLCGHMGGNRQDVLACKPAPVIATWLGYLGTTGLDEVDFRIVDMLTDPPGLTESHHSERLIRLPHSQWCYAPPANDWQVSELPALKVGHITFGSPNNVMKLSDSALHTWATLLARVPGSRLSLAAIPGGHACQRISRIFAEHGVGQERLTFLPRMAFDAFMRYFQQIDIALDPWPYTGGTTTCNALYMGVPVLTLAGSHSVARSGASLMTNVGLPEFVATSPDDFVVTGVRLSTDWPALARVRAGLRQRFMASPVGDQAHFAQDFAQALEQMWAQRLTPSR